MHKIFVVLGATGNIGHIVVEDLLKRGHEVRAVGRDKKKLHELEILGAISYSQDFDDVDAITDSFKDAFAVFSFLPPGYAEEDYSAFQDRVGDAIVQAIQNAHIENVINLSSIGAHHPKGTGPIVGLHRHEEKLNKLKNLNTLFHLRSSWFMENLNGYIPMIQKEGVIKSCINKDLPVPLVATRDIGWKIADFLDKCPLEIHSTFEFVGPQSLKLPEIADIFGKALHKTEVKYVQISYEEQKKQFLANGMKSKTVDLFIEMYKAFNDGLIKSTQTLKPEHHGITSFEEYAQMQAHKVFTPTRS